MQRLLGTLMFVSVLLLAGMILLAHGTLANGSHDAQQDAVAHHLTRIQSAQTRIEKKLHDVEDQLAVATSAAATSAAAASAAATTAAAASKSDADDCPGRVPFHGLLTCQGSVYQQWQARIMYFHWKKQAAAAGPCGDMGGFTRLVASEGGKPDGLEGEIPSVFVPQLPASVIESHFHFGVLNRPESVRQLLASPALLRQITSDFVLVLETDHVLMQPIPNLATRTTPAAFTFGYMHAHASQDWVIQRYWPEGSSASLDPVGPSPLLIHLDQLRAIAPRWLNFSLGLRSNADAERVMQGWVQEMWGYSIAAASLGVKHRLVRNFQVEYGASAGRIPPEFPTLSYIFHYTYGIEYTLQGRPQGVMQIGEWSLDKRHYGADHPPRGLQLPPDGANAAAFWLTRAWNEASAGIPAWPDSHSMGTVGWRRNKPTADELAASPLARRVEGSRWSWSGVAGFEFARGGELVTPWGKGVWGLVSKAAGGADDPSKDAQVKACADCLFADFANANHNVRFSWDADPPTFRSVRVGDLQEVAGKWLGGGGPAA